jgi:hypothetical protein
LRSERYLQPRAHEVAEGIMALPHVVPADELAAREVGRLEALVEAIDGELARVGMDGRGPRVSMLLDMRLRASRRLMEALDRFGATPLARARWARELAEGESLAASIARRRRAAEAEP